MSDAETHLAVVQYMDLTARIKTLTDLRRDISAKLPIGRFTYDDQPMDVVVSESHRSTVSVVALRRYVTDAIIKNCTTYKKSRSVKVMPKVKPKKAKKVGRGIL